MSVTPAYTAGRGQVAPFAATAVYMNPAAWRLRALRNLQSGQFASGLRVLDEWISQRPDEFEPQFLRIQMLLQCGQVRDAADAAMAISAAADCPPEMAAEFVRCLRHFSAHDALIDCRRETLPKSRPISPPWGHTMPPPIGSRPRSQAIPTRRPRELVGHSSTFISAKSMPQRVT